MVLTCPFCTEKRKRVKLKPSKKRKNLFFCPKCRKKFHIKPKHNGKKKTTFWSKGKIGSGKEIDYHLLEAYE